MNHNLITSNSKTTREQMIQMLYKDLVSEYQSIIAFIVYSQVLKRASHADIARELEMHAAEDFQHAKQIAKQIEYLGGTQCVRLNAITTPKEPCAMLLSSIVRNLEHEIDLASLLGIGTAHPDCLASENSSKPRSTRVRSTSPKSAMPNQKSVRRNTAKRSAGKISR
jgi:bacterioferritin (cytochrome b1)